MKKIIITESQLKKLSKTLKESSGLNDKYKIQCEVDFDFDSGSLKHNGVILYDADITTYKITIYYDIKPMSSSYGISSFMFSDLEGPKTTELQIKYYDEDDNEQEIYVDLELDWDNNIVEEDTEDIDYIGYDNIIKLRLVNDNNGDIVCDEIVLNKKDM
jgi:hypothetical protein